MTNRRFKDFEESFLSDNVCNQINNWLDLNPGIQIHKWESNCIAEGIHAKKIVIIEYSEAENENCNDSAELGY